MDIMKFILQWLPRASAIVLAVAVWMLAGIGAHGREGVGLMPFLLLLLPLAIGWHFKRIGGSLFILLGLALWFVPNARQNLDVLPFMSAPFLVVGLLFWADALSKPKKSRDEVLQM
jgi:hypothetical protein